MGFELTEQMNEMKKEQNSNNQRILKDHDHNLKTIMNQHKLEMDNSIKEKTNLIEQIQVLKREQEESQRMIRENYDDDEDNYDNYDDDNNNDPTAATISTTNVRSKNDITIISLKQFMNKKQN